MEINHVGEIFNIAIASGTPFNNEKKHLKTITLPIN
jgi:hypothetical protein